MERFDFEKAFMFWRNVPAPSGFLLKYIAAYSIAQMALLVLAVWLISPLVGPFMEFVQVADEAGDPERLMQDFFFTYGLRFFLITAVTIVLSIIVWAMFEAMVQRRYQRQEGFTLRFGADEFRMIGVGFCWFLFMVGVMLVTVLLGMIIIGFIVGPVLGVFLAVRLSPAAALTIRDRKLTFFDAWAVTKGRFWPMFGGFLVIMIAFGIINQVLQSVVMGGLMTSLLPEFQALEASGIEDPADFFAILLSPIVLGTVGAMYFLMYIMQSFVMYAMAGIPGLAAQIGPGYMSQSVIDEF